VPTITEDKKMQSFLMCSRHNITPEQYALALKAGITLHQGTDLDAFAANHDLIKQVCDQGVFEGVIVVHPALALKLSTAYRIGVFENANRAPEGAPPSFQAVGFEVFDLVPRLAAWEYAANYDMIKV